MIKLTHLRNATKRIRLELNSISAYVDKSRVEVVSGFQNSLGKEYVKTILSDKKEKIVNMAEHNKENQARNEQTGYSVMGVDYLKWSQKKSKRHYSDAYIPIVHTKVEQLVES
jgi:hypothetical protein